METREWRTIDKTGWPDGPWLGEPDKKQWTDRASGLPCLVVRNSRHGNLNGYVGVAPGHPRHGLSILQGALQGLPSFPREILLIGPGDVRAFEVSGLYFTPERGDGDPAQAWWLGFPGADWRDYLGEGRPSPWRLGIAPPPYLAFAEAEALTARLAALLAAEARQEVANG